MLLEKGERSMVINEANVINKGENFYIEFKLSNSKVQIPLTEDKPNEVKCVFNKIITELKKGEFKFELNKMQDNLYYQISDLYIKQLNNELHSVFSELKDYDLVSKKI